MSVMSSSVVVEKKSADLSRLSLGCSGLDEVLGGGLESGIITKIYGEAGSGKTNVCLQAAREASCLGLGVVYVDSEGVSGERLEQICSGCSMGLESVLDRIRFFEVKSLEQQEEVIRSLGDLEDVGLVVIDTLNMLYRMKTDEENREESFRSLARQVSDLQMLARTKKVFVLVAEQVYRDHRSGEVRPFTITNAEHMMKTILRLDRGEELGCRQVTVIRHRSVAEGKSSVFCIDECGLL